ncbi:MAG: sigma-70 factor domain-containing protein, partial [Synechococcaceae cyanobacterium]
MHPGTNRQSPVAGSLSSTDPVRQYLQEIGRVARLSEEEELL